MTGPHFANFLGFPKEAYFKGKLRRTNLAAFARQCAWFFSRLTKHSRCTPVQGKGELRTYWLLGHKAGPQHRRGDGNQFLPAPLFNVGDGGSVGGAMAAPHRSPKTEGLPRRGSLIPKLPDHDTDLLGTALMNGSVMGGIQASTLVASGTLLPLREVLGNVLGNA